MTQDNKIKLQCAEIELLSEGIVRIVFESDYQVELSDAIEVEKVYLELKGDEGDVYSLMNTTGRFNQFSQEAQKFFAKESVITVRLIASAYVIDNLANRLLARFFMKFYRPAFEMKIFQSEELAVEWLTSVKKEREAEKREQITM